MGEALMNRCSSNSQRNEPAQTIYCNPSCCSNNSTKTEPAQMSDCKMSVAITRKGVFARDIRCNNSKEAFLLETCSTFEPRQVIATMTRLGSFETLRVAAAAAAGAELRAPTFNH